MRTKPTITQLAGRYCIEASELITGDRARTHGDFIVQHERAAIMIRAYIKAKFDVDLELRASDIIRFLTIVKDSRSMTGAFNDDHARDCVGYEALRAVALEQERG